MALRVYVEGKLLISQDNATNPQEPTFNSGSKNFTDVATYNESAGYTFDVPMGTIDAQINMGSIGTAQVMYLMAKGADLSVKLVPTGQVLADALSFKLLQDVPAILPFQIIEVYVSNSGTASEKLVFGAAGN